MKRVFVGLFTVFLMFFGLAANVYAAGYVCDSAVKYTSCGAGFFMTYGGAFNSTAQVENACSSCPSDAEFCPGHTYAPAYKVTLNASGGSGGTSAIYRIQNVGWFSSLLKNETTKATTVSAIGTQITTITKPTKTGYTFKGFYDAQSDGTQTITSAGVVSASNAYGTATWYAQWTANTYTIKYDSAGGSAVSNTTCTYGQNCTVSSTKPTKTGYTFNGWKYGSTTYQAGATVSNLTSTNGGSVTFTAQWTANTYTIKYDSAGGSAVSDTTCTYGQNCTVSSTKPTKTGYTFNGWKYGSTTYQSGATVSNLTSTNGGSVTFTAQWTANTYTIKYDSAGGSAVSDTTCTYGQNCTVSSTKPTKTGYTFNGWKYGSTTYQSGATVSNLTSTNGGSVTFTAQWTANSYTCSAGKYLNITTCETCKAGYYCPGGTRTYDGVTHLMYTCPTGYTSDAGNTAQNKCYVTTTAGNYIANANDSAQTTCSENNYCPGGVKVTYGSTGGANTCPDPSTHKPTVLPGSDYVFDDGRTAYAFWINVGLSDINRCAAVYGFTTNAGYVTYEGVRYDSSAGKYGMTTSSIYWSRVNPGYYLKTRYLDDYCSSNTSRSMLYREVSTCPAGSYCPGGSVPGCSSGTYNDTFGVYTCPENSTSSAGASVCKCNDGYVTENGAQTTTQACELFEPKFTATTISNTSSFDFSISAAGKFYVDWGDDSDIQVIERSDTGYLQSYSHTYSTPGSYEIKLSGKATGYSSYYEAISFSENSDLAKIDGSLGAIFSTLADGSQPLFGSPRFHGTFFRCYNLSGEIPANLFEGITGQPVAHMFMDTFNACPKLEGPIPKDLFAGLNGNVTPYLFYGTFGDCTGLTGDIPQGLFSGIKGVPQTKMFQATFYNCPKLEGPIPKDLFAGIDGEPQADMFWLTFGNDAGLTGSIPENLFENIKGTPANGMFFGTFYGCSGLTGTIPEGLFAKVNGDPADQAFENTFYGTSGLSGFVPNNLFAGISQPDVATATDQMTNVFTASGLGVACPAGEYQYMTGFESYFGGKVSCTPCPNGYDDGGAGLTAINQCQMTVESGKYIATAGADTVTNCPVNNMCPGGKVNYTDTGIISTCPTNSSTNGATGQASCTCNTGYNYNGGTIATTNACVANTYTIKYNTNGGDGSIADTTCTYGQNCTVSSTKPTKTGYTFDGWQYGSTTYQSGSTIDTNLTSTNGASVTFTAQWTANTFTVIYVSDGGDGSMANTICTYDTDCYISANTYTKTGYIFKNWANYDKSQYFEDGANLKNASSTQGAGLFLYAQWEPITYTVRYDANGGSGSIADTTCTYGQNCTVSSTKPTKTGYTFNGWKYGDEIYQPGDTVINLTSNDGSSVTLTGQWTPITYTIRYDANGGSGSMQNTTCTYDIPCELRENTYTMTGHHFDGWWFAGSSKVTTVLNATEWQDEEVVVQAIWLPDQIQCPAGQYLDGLYCIDCEDEYYCEGGEWLYDGGIHGRTDCPAVTNKYGAAFAYNGGLLDETRNSSVNQCRALFAYLPKWFADLGETEFDGDDLDWNANNRGYYVVDCKYNTTTQQYDSDCRGYATFCDTGYVSNFDNDILDVQYGNIDVMSLMVYASNPQEAINNICVPVGYNNWSAGAEQCVSLPEEETEKCMFSDTNITHACPDGGVTLTDTAGSIEECMLPVVECSTEVGTGVRSCMYEEETGAYTNCDLCSVSSCYSGLYMNNGVCVTCPAGSACSDNNITTCGANTWTETNSAQCNACPANSSTNGATGQASCTCNTGYNYNGGTTVTTNACVANTFTVKYNAGLGSGDMADVVCNYDGGCVAANNAFVMTGYNFVGWLCSGGSCDGKVIQPGASLVNATAENNAVINLTAQWSISSISCDAGYYLNGDVCAECPDDSFCTGGAWEYNGQVQGLEKCPTITEKYGAASAELLDALEHAPHSAANQCRAVFGYAERWYLDLQNNTNVDAGYDDKVNERGVFYVSCDYNPVTKLYDANCTGVALMCGPGYWSPHNADITDVNDLINNVYVATGPQDAIENTCAKVGDGYWSPSAEGQLDNNAGDILQQLSLQYIRRNQCKDALRTIGYGKGADESTDCGRILHIGENKLYLRSVKRTTPSLHVRVDGVVYYGDMSKTETKMNTESNRALRIVDKGIPYWVHDDSVL